MPDAALSSPSATSAAEVGSGTCAWTNHLTALFATSPLSHCSYCTPDTAIRLRTSMCIPLKSGIENVPKAASRLRALSSRRLSA